MCRCNEICAQLATCRGRRHRWYCRMMTTVVGRVSGDRGIDAHLHGFRTRQPTQCCARSRLVPQRNLPDNLHRRCQMPGGKMPFRADADKCHDGDCRQRKTSRPRKHPRARPTKDGAPDHLYTHRIDSLPQCLSRRQGLQCLFERLPALRSIVYLIVFHRYLSVRSAHSTITILRSPLQSWRAGMPPVRRICACARLPA